MADVKDGPCPVCGEERQHASQEAEAEPPAPRGPWRMVVCEGCESLYLRPRPADPASLYGVDYHVYKKPGRLGAQAARAAGTVSALLAARRAGERGSAVYEIGCGTGETLRALTRLGYDATGIEVSVAAAKAARANGVQVTEGAFEGGRGVAGKYELVVAQHVLEHVDDPRRFLDDVRRILRPGGRVLLKVPVAGSFAELVFGGYAGNLDLPYHMFVPTRAALRRLVEDAGLVIESERPGLLPNDWIHGIRKAARGGVGLPLPFVRPWNPFVALPLLPFSLAAGLAGGPSRVTLVARKPI